MDLAYWQARCEAAESALERARSGLVMNAERVAVIGALGDLRPGEWATTMQIATLLFWSPHKAVNVLGGMHAVGLVDRTPEGTHGGRGRVVSWKLAHLVQVQSEAEAEVA